MSRPKTKAELISETNLYYTKLNDFINSMSQNELTTEFDFSANNKKEAHWSRDKNLKDVITHLYEWHCLLIHWIEENEKGNEIQFLKPGYTWATYGKMNLEFFEKHKNTSLADAIANFDKTHKKVLSLMENYTDEQLFTKGVYKWVGGSTLGQYFISTTIGHYDWALKKLKLHRKNCAANS